jgi:hypothetical protein
LHALVAGGAGPISLDMGDVAIVLVALGIEIVREAGIRVPGRRFGIAFATLLALQLATYPGPAAQFVYFKF